MCVCVSVCVCVSENERKNNRNYSSKDIKKKEKMISNDYVLLYSIDTLQNKHDRRRRDRDEKTEQRLSTLLLLLFNFPCSLFKSNDLPRVDR